MEESDEEHRLMKIESKKKRRDMSKTGTRVLEIRQVLLKLHDESQF